jgi:hypothetical protein
MSTNSTRNGKRRGAAALEFGLWMPVICILLGGVADFSWMISRYHNVVRAARDGCRSAIAIKENINQTTGARSPSDGVSCGLIHQCAKSHAEAILDGVGMPCGSGCVVQGEMVTLGAPGGSAVRVNITYPFEPLIGLMPVPVNMQASFTMRVQQDVCDGAEIC